MQKKGGNRDISAVQVKLLPEKKKQIKKLVSNNVATMEKEVISSVKGRVKAGDTCKPTVRCCFGSTSYNGLCYMGSSTNLIPYTLYVEILDKIYFSEIQTTKMDLRLANGTFRKPYGILPDLYVVLGTFTYHLGFCCNGNP